VFQLHKHVKFHDGTDFDAEAVRWNYRRLMRPEERGLHHSVERLIEAVNALDAHTVRFTLAQPCRNLLPGRAASVEFRAASGASAIGENCRGTPCPYLISPFTID
jgi:ABC-type transport system substrate-binding protein